MLISAYAKIVYFLYKKIYNLCFYYNITIHALLKKYLFLIKNLISFLIRFELN